MPEDAVYLQTWSEYHYFADHISIFFTDCIELNWSQLTQAEHECRFPKLSWVKYLISFFFFKCVTKWIVGAQIRSDHIQTSRLTALCLTLITVMCSYCDVVVSACPRLSGSVPFSVPVTDFPMWSIYLAGGSAAICSAEGSRAPHATFTHTHTYTHTFSSLKDTHTYM